MISLPRRTDSTSTVRMRRIPAQGTAAPRRWDPDTGKVRGQVCSGCRIELPVSGDCENC
jgi:hypothetical protein